jgi:hypothetical protein
MRLDRRQYGMTRLDVQTNTLACHAYSLGRYLARSLAKGCRRSSRSR